MMTGKVAQLVKGKDDKYYCSYCRMRANLNEDACDFCGSLWTNWEEIQHQLWELYFKDLTSIKD